MTEEDKAEMIDALRDAIGRIELGQISDCIFVGVPAETSRDLPRVLFAKMGGGLMLAGAVAHAHRVAVSTGYGEPAFDRIGFEADR